MAGDARFVGLWAVYAGPVYSELSLDESGSYRHSAFDGSRAHWGVWDLEAQNGQQWLVLHLQGAQPMAEPTPMGMQPIQWPSFEAFPITNVQQGEIDFTNGMMRRVSDAQNSSPSFSAPAYPGAPPVTFAQAGSSLGPPPLQQSEAAQPQPTSQPSAQSSSSGQTATPQSGAVQGAETSLASPPPTIIQQWQAAQQQNNQIAQMYAQMQAQDQVTDDNIEKIQTGAAIDQYNTQSQINDMQQKAYDDSNQAFIQSMR